MAALGLTALLIFVGSSLLYMLSKFLKLRKIIDKIPGPRAYLLIGNLHQFKAESDDWFEQSIGVSTLYLKPRMLRIWLGWMPYIMIYGADEAEAILSSNNQAHIIKGQEYRMARSWLGLSLLTSSGQKWHQRRKLLTPTFHYDILKDFVEVFNQQAKVLVAKWAKKSQLGQAFDAYPDITLCALDVICETAMGRNLSAQDYGDKVYLNALYKANEILHERQKKPWVHPDFLFNLIGRGKEFANCLQVLHGFTRRVIKERYEHLMAARAANSDQSPSSKENGANSKRRQAFLDLLLDMYFKDQLSMNDIQNEVDTFMFEGHDTTSASMSWTLHLLGCNPEIQAKVHEELDSIFADEDRDIRNEDLSSLHLLERCIKEALRLFPSVPLFSRYLHEPITILGYEVPAGTHLIINPHAVHRDPKHWPDPEVFDPDRFLPENLANRHPFAYIPFSGGLRNCIGQRFALMEEKTVLSWILRYFTVHSVHRRDIIRPCAQLILRPKQGAWINLEMRKEANFF